MISKRITAAMLGLAMAMASTVVRADDPAPAKVDNPLFVVWSKFDVGASCSYEAELPSGPEGKKVHAAATSVLKEKTADGVKVETTGKVGDEAMPVDTDTIPAKLDAADVKKTGEEDVKVGDKTYKCKVYELAPAAAGEKEGPTLTVYVCDDVPGGIVKATGKGPDGKDLTYMMTEFKAK